MQYEIFELNFHDEFSFACAPQLRAPRAGGLVMRHLRDSRPHISAC